MNYQELVAQRDALDQEIARIFEQERDAAICDVCAQIQKYFLTAAECGFVAAPKATVTPIQARKKAVVKFRGPQGQEWSGRGRKPNWLVACIHSGFSLDDLRVEKEAV